MDARSGRQVYSVMHQQESSCIDIKRAIMRRVRKHIRSHGRFVDVQQIHVHGIDGTLTQVLGSLLKEILGKSGERVRLQQFKSINTSSENKFRLIVPLCAEHFLLLHFGYMLMVGRNVLGEKPDDHMSLPSPDHVNKLSQNVCIPRLQLPLQSPLEELPMIDVLRLHEYEQASNTSNEGDDYDLNEFFESECGDVRLTKKYFELIQRQLIAWLHDNAKESEILSMLHLSKDQIDQLVEILPPVTNYVYALYCRAPDTLLSHTKSFQQMGKLSMKELES